MLRGALVFLAKRSPAVPTPRKKVLKRLGRSASKGVRASSAKRRLSPSRRNATSAGGKGGATAGGDALATTDGSVEAGNGSDALVRVSSEEGRTPPSSAVTTHAVAKAMTYRLATAVSTVVVPPLANAYLESMKQTLTPAVRRPQDGSLRGGGGFGEAPAPPMEEYYTSKKGPLFATAVIAGTNAVKQASLLIPFCHPIPIQKCSFTFRRRAVGSTLNHSALPHRVVLRKRSSAPSPRPSRAEYSVLYCFCTVATEEYKTGVEMEALTGATVAAMTLYDMLKGLPGAQEDGLSLGESFVLAKRGGKNDFIKLLMSEPERPEAPKPSPAAIPSNSKDHSVADATTAAEAKAKEREEEDDEEETATPEKSVRTVVKKSVPSAAATAAAASTTAATAEEDTPGDSGAWWRTSRHERKLQEMNPRRKYGEGARLAPIPTSAELKAKTRPAPPPPPKVEVAVEEEETAAEVEDDDENDIVEPTPAPARGKAHGKASVVATPAAKPKPRGKVSKGRAPPGELEEEDAEDVGGKGRKARSGQLVKKSARAPAPKDDEPDESEEVDEEADEEVAEEEQEEEEEVAPAKPAPKKGGRSKPAPKGKKAASSKAAARARAAEAYDEEDEDATEAEADDDTQEEEEEERMKEVRAARNKRSAAAPRPKAAARRSHRGRNYDDVADVDETNDAANDDEEEEEEVVSLDKEGKLHAVKHDSWDDETVVEEDEEEEAPPPPPPKSLRKKKKFVRRS